jgi:hypothetical protein
VPNRKQKQGLTEGYYLEMLDRLYVQMSVLEDHLIDHEVAKKHSEIRKHIIDSVSSLIQAYHITGTEILKTKKKDK